MSAYSNRELRRARRHARVRKKVTGTSERPRLVVRRSDLHLYAQIIDDLSGKSLLMRSTAHPDFKKKYKKGGNVEAAKKLGEEVANAAKMAGIKKVVFDRGGYLYHGRVKALADSARAQGLEF
ncbi:MAG: 50S ribosomal protein L18 [Candidatus Omnitrophica bacterium]|nr:50S ribosomal protein L18 [Candidatus Omnitrophota bacterium]